MQLFRGLALSASVVEAVTPDFKRAPVVAICALFAFDSGQAGRFRCQKSKNSGFVPAQFNLVLIHRFTPFFC
nr:MAG TPA: CtsR-like protein [Caudoviricetes sp.]